MEQENRKQRQSSKKKSEVSSGWVGQYGVIPLTYLFDATYLYSDLNNTGSYLHSHDTELDSNTRSRKGMKSTRRRMKTKVNKDEADERYSSSN